MKRPPGRRRAACSRPTRHRAPGAWPGALALCALIGLGLGAATPAGAADPSGLAAQGPGGEDAAPALALQQVSARVYFVQGELGPVSRANRGFNANAGFVVTADGVLVFDALGTPVLGRALRQAIRSVTSLPIRHIVISHYHADHFYGLQAFADTGAPVWAGAKVGEYLASEAPAARLAERRGSLAPWVDADTRIVPPTRFIDRETTITLGGVRCRLLPVGPAHTAEDLMMLVEDDGVLFAGDLVFAGRVPFVGDADSRAWLAAIEGLAGLAPTVMVTGHGGVSRQPLADLALTRDYLKHLRHAMAEAVREMLSFDEAYARTDWSRYAALPAFEAANRRNAYNTFLLMEQEALRAR